MLRVLQACVTGESVPSVTTLSIYTYIERPGSLPRRDLAVAYSTYCVDHEHVRLQPRMPFPSPTRCSVGRTHELAFELAVQAETDKRRVTECAHVTGIYWQKSHATCLVTPQRLSFIVDGATQA